MKKHILFGYILGLLTIVSCGSVSYKYYGLDLTPQCYSQGSLLGVKPSDDLPFTECQPDAKIKGKCLIMFEQDFFAAKKELLELRQALSDCQKGAPPK